MKCLELLSQCLDFSQRIFILLPVHTYGTAGPVVVIHDHRDHDGMLDVHPVMVPMVVDHGPAESGSRLGGRDRRSQTPARDFVV